MQASFGASGRGRGPTRRASSVHILSGPGAPAEILIFFRGLSDHFGFWGF